MKVVWSKENINIVHDQVKSMYYIKIDDRTLDVKFNDFNFIKEYVLGVLFNDLTAKTALVERLKRIRRRTEEYLRKSNDQKILIDLSVKFNLSID